MTTTNVPTGRPDQPQPQHLIIRNSRHNAPKTKGRVRLEVGKIPTKTNGTPSNQHTNTHTELETRRQERAEMTTENIPRRPLTRKTTQHEGASTVTPEKGPTNATHKSGPTTKGETTAQEITGEALNERQPDQAANVTSTQRTTKTQKSIKDYMKKAKKQKSRKHSGNEEPANEDEKEEPDHEDMEEAAATVDTIELNFIQCNLKKKPQAMKTLGTSIIGSSNPIILMTEPYARTNKKIATIHKDLAVFQDMSEKPRAAIAIPKSLSKVAWKLDIGNDRDSCSILLQTDKNRYILSSIYMDQKKDINHHLITELKEKANEMKAKLIIGTDSNSHHKNWEDKKTDKRGKILMGAITDNNLTWANHGKKPTFMNSMGGNSIIDLTLTNEAARRSIKDWEVTDEVTSSDHKYIRFNVKDSMKKKGSRKIINTDWEKFREELHKSQILREITRTEIKSCFILDMMATKLHKEIMRCWKIACPITFSSNTFKKLKWQTEEVQQAKEKIIKLLNKRKNRRNTKKIDKKIAQANKEYEKIAERAQIKSWKDFTGDINSTHQASRMNKILKSTGVIHTQPGTIKNNEGQLATSPKETMDNLIKYHFGEETESKETHTIKYRKPDEDLSEKIFSKERIIKAIINLKSKKAPGPDGVTNDMIKEGKDYLLEPIQNIFMASHRLQIPPTTWTLSKGLFLSKPGKDDYQSPKAYRTITLSPTLLKLHEKLLLWYLEVDCQIYKRISNKQHGFKKGQSVITALHKCIHTIEKRMAKSGMVLAMFLDIQGAFDNVSFKSIEKAMDNANIDKQTTSWITNWLTNRKITLEMIGEKRTVKIRKGCPQGGVLSPLLWLLVIDDILRKGPKDIPALINGFADDLCCLTEGTEKKKKKKKNAEGTNKEGRTVISVMKQRMQATANYINEWCSRQGLKLSASKTVLVLFSKKEVNKQPSIKIGGHEIKTSDQAKLLGVILDKRLNFKEHMEQSIKKAHACLARTRSAVGKQWGLNPTTIKWIYTAVVRPVLEYGIAVTSSAINYVVIAQKLRSLQATALRMVTGAYSRTAIADLNILTNTIDIVEYLKMAAAKTMINLTATGNWTKEDASHKGHVKNASTYTNEIKTLKVDVDTPKLNLDNKFDTIIPTDQRLYTETIITGTKDTNIQCYTDGSKNEKNETGCGFYIEKQGKEIESGSLKLPKPTTVFQAEVMAITKAAEKLKERNIKNENIKIWVDSQAAIKALQALKTNKKTVSSCITELNDLAKDNNVTVQWIKAHVGFEGNEKADKLAKKGSTEGEEIPCPTPMSHINKSLKDTAIIRTEDFFAQKGGKDTKRVYADAETSTMGRNGEYITYNLNRNKPNTGNTKQRKHMSSITHMITGHAPTRSYLHKIGKTESDTCRLCEEETETIEHILTKCPGNMLERHKVFEGVNFYNHISALRTSIIKSTKIYDHFIKRAVEKEKNLNARITSK